MRDLAGDIGCLRALWRVEGFGPGIFTLETAESDLTADVEHSPRRRDMTSRPAPGHVHPPMKTFC